MQRYVILEHDWPVRHWDLLVEAGTVLRAWRLLEEPRLGGAVPAETNVDHRLAYLDYEGPVSGGRGTVRQWDAGVYEPLPAAPVATDVTEQAGVSETDRGPVELQIMLKGRRWQVCCQLWRQSGDPGGRLWACFTAVEPPSPRPGSDPLQ